MGRLKAVVAVVILGLVPVAAACGGDSGAIADSQIVDALKLKKSPDGPYAIGGDPFCEVNDDLLNDSEEIDVARDGAGSDLVITNGDESVGIQAVPPFDPACARKARRELERIE